MPGTIVRHTRRFDRRPVRLARRHPQVYEAVSELMDEAEQGNRPGSRYRRVGEEVYRVRLVNRSARTGKRGGFRIAYHVDDDNAVALIAICVRSECRD